jgi:hypothetical protein
MAGKMKTEALKFADQVRELLDQSRLTSYAIGQLAGVKPEVIRRFRREERDMTLDTTGRIFEALGVPPLVAPRRWPSPATSRGRS